MFKQTDIEGLLLYSPPTFTDNRGQLMLGHVQALFSAQGLNMEFVQDIFSTSKVGTLRGLHLQTGEHAQAKLVTVLFGEVYDVVVDMRPGSATYGEWRGFHLQSSEPQFLLVPRGFAHGFLALTDQARFYYKVDNAYCSEAEAGIRYDDESLNISWPQIDGGYLLSDKDKILPSLQEFEGLFL